jgi:hypothetical protein
MLDSFRLTADRVSPLQVHENKKPTLSGSPLSESGGRSFSFPRTLSLRNPQRSTASIVRKFHWSFCPNGTKHSCIGGIMSITIEILSLRRDRSSCVAALLNAIEWECAAEDDTRTLARKYDVLRMADIVLLNVAAHAANVLSHPPAIPQPRRATSPPRRKRRRPDPPQLHQRQLFA